MEFVTALISFLVFIFIVTKLLRRTSSSYSPLDQIPGPRRLPLIGNLHLVASNSLLHHLFRDLATKYGPLFRLQLGQIPILVVSSVEVAEQVLKTHDQIFANRPDLGFTAKALTYDRTNISLSPFGEYWRHLRKICTHELLSLGRVRLFRPIRDDENHNLFQWIALKEGSPANISERVHLSSFGLTTRASVGNKAEDEKSVTSVLKEVMKLGSGLTIPDLYPSIKFLPLISGMKFKIGKIFRQTDKILGDIIHQHKVAKATNHDGDTTETLEDLADILLKYDEDGAKMPLTTGNIKAVLLDLFLAGGETSATVIEWTMSEMIKNPATLKKAQEEVRRVFDNKGYVDEAQFDELKYLKLVIKEGMRLHPPFPLLVPRQNSQRCEINGYEIPAKTRVIVNSWLLGRDPKYWDEPNKFIPERFIDSSYDFKGTYIEYMPFGAGRRICPGIPFGMANVESTLAMLLYHFDWEMPNGIKNEELDMTELFGTSCKRKKDLLLIPTVKRPLQVV